MALLQVITGTACNNKTGCIGQPTYAESMIHETSEKKKKQRELMVKVTKGRAITNLVQQHQNLPQNQKPARNR